MPIVGEAPLVEGVDAAFIEIEQVAGGAEVLLEGAGEDEDVVAVVINAQGATEMVGAVEQDLGLAGAGTAC